MNEPGTLKAREERKRERCWPPALREQALQSAIAWAEAQQAVKRNSKETCLRLQAQKLAAVQLSTRGGHQP